MVEDWAYPKYISRRFLLQVLFDYSSRDTSIGSRPNAERKAGSEERGKAKEGKRKG